MRRILLLACLLVPLPVLAAVLPAVPATGAVVATTNRQVPPGEDLANMRAAYGRIIGPGGQLRNLAYLPALVQASNATEVAQLLAQAATPTRPALSPGNLVPGWNVGNPLRAGWAGTRGRMQRVAFTNRYGALLRGTLFAPKRHARDPYTGRWLHGPFPGVVITPGSVQGSEGMYRWLGEDLAERGYVVLTFDVQGEGTSETLPHTTGQAFPFCDPFGKPGPGEMTACPGVPFQQLANFVVGTEDALRFFTSTPRRPYANPGAAGAPVDGFNPWWRLFERAPDPHPVTPGRTTRLAIIGHSMGAAAVSKVQVTDRKVATVVALDKLTGPSSPPPLDGTGNTPTVPALAVQSEYGFTVTPADLSGGSSLTPEPSNGVDPMRERRTGFDDWHRAGVDSMLVVPRASTHLEYTDIPLVLPASRWGQDLTSAYVQRWLDRYLKHRGGDRVLTETRFRYLEPVGHGVWKPVVLHRGALLSKRYCSAYSVRSARPPHRMRYDGDVAHVGC